MSSIFKICNLYSRFSNYSLKYNADCFHHCLNIAKYCLKYCLKYHLKYYFKYLKILLKILFKILLKYYLIYCLKYCLTAIKKYLIYCLKFSDQIWLLFCEFHNIEKRYCSYSLNYFVQQNLCLIFVKYCFKFSDDFLFYCKLLYKILLRCSLPNPLSCLLNTV